MKRERGRKMKGKGKARNMTRETEDSQIEISAC